MCHCHNLILLSVQIFQKVKSWPTHKLHNSVVIGQHFGNSVRELESMNYLSSSMGSWTLWLTTSPDCERTHLSSANVVVCGVKGSSSELPLTRGSQSLMNKTLIFEPSAVDEFEVCIFLNFLLAYSMT